MMDNHKSTALMASSDLHGALTSTSTHVSNETIIMELTNSIVWEQKEQTLKATAAYWRKCTKFWKRGPLAPPPPQNFMTQHIPMIDWLNDALNMWHGRFFRYCSHFDWSNISKGQHGGVMVRIVTTKGPLCMLSVCSPRVCASSLQVLPPTL